MNYKILSIISFIILLPILGKWITDSNEYGQVLMFSKDKMAIEKTVKDDLFGTVTTEIEWIDGFWLGLLPPTDQFSMSILLGVVPLSAIFISLGVLFLFLNSKSKKINIK